jgi:hypothetical protein
MSGKKLEEVFIERGYRPYDSDKGVVLNDGFSGELIKKIIFLNNQKQTGNIKDFVVIPEKEFRDFYFGDEYRILIKNY